MANIRVGNRANKAPRVRYPFQEGARIPENVADPYFDALRGLGRSVQGLGASVKAAQAQKDKRDEYNAQLEFIRLGIDDEFSFAERTRNMEPGDPQFAEKAYEDYQERYQGFIKSLQDRGYSKEIIDKFRIQAAQREAGIAQASIKVEESGRDVANLIEFNETARALGSRVQQDPSTYDDSLAALDEAYEASKGVMDPEVALKAYDAAKSQLLFAQAWGKAKLDPEGVVETISPTKPEGDYYSRLRRESGGRAGAQNPRSSAAGLYQFTQSTWNRVRRQFPELGLGTYESGAWRSVDQQEKAIRALTGLNERALRNAGIPVNDTTRYAAHFLGSGGAVKVLKAPDFDPLSAHVSSEVMSANPHLQGKTVGQFKQWAANFIGGKPLSVKSDSGLALLDQLTAQQQRQILGVAQSEISSNISNARSQLNLDEDNAIARAISGKPHEGAGITYDRYEEAYPKDEVTARREFEDFQGRLRVASETRNFVTQDPGQIQSTIDAFESGIADSDPLYADKQKALSSMKEAAADVREMWRTDPVGTAVNYFPQVNAAFDAYANDPTNSALAKAYRSQLEQAYKTVGLANSDWKVWTPQEATRMKDLWDSASPAETVNSLIGMRDTMSQEMFDAAMQELETSMPNEYSVIAEWGTRFKDDAPGLPMVYTNALAGLRKLYDPKTGEKLLRVDDSVVETFFQTELGLDGTALFAMPNGQLNGLKRLTLGLAAYMGVGVGDAIDPDVMRQAFNLLVGGDGTEETAISSSGQLMPPGVSYDDWDNMQAALKYDGPLDEYKTVDGDIVTVTPENIANSGKLVRVSIDEYAVWMPDSGVVYTDEGIPFKMAIDRDAVEDILDNAPVDRFGFPMADRRAAAQERAAFMRGITEELGLNYEDIERAAQEDTAADTLINLITRERKREGYEPSSRLRDEIKRIQEGELATQGVPQDKWMGIILKRILLDLARYENELDNSAEGEFESPGGGGF